MIMVAIVAFAAGYVCWHLLCRDRVFYSFFSQYSMGFRLGGAKHVLCTRRAIARPMMSRT